MTSSIRMRGCIAAVAMAALGVTAEEPPGQWREIGRSGALGCGAAVYSPTRKQILRWGEFGNDRNAVWAFDAENGQWSTDYEPDKAAIGGTFYGGQNCAGWVSATERPGPFFLFRQACWDSLRNRMVIVALNLTAAYDPTEKKWSALQVAFENASGLRQEAHGPAGYEKPWFAPVPGQWGSCAYDPINDEIMLFPLWVCRLKEWTHQGLQPTGPEMPADAGVRGGHFGTLLFDCKTNTWRLPELGSRDLLAARARLAALIDGQREVCRSSWRALIASRQEQQAEAARLMVPAAAAQQALAARLSAEIAALDKGAARLQRYEAAQLQEALRNLAAPLARATQAAAGLAAGKPADLPALCSQQRAAYRELRLIHAEDLHVQPIPRCSTSVVYDQKNRCMVMAGGTHLDRSLNDTWVYDCQTRRWQRRAPVPEALEWPGMCYDSKRGATLYAAPKGTYAYDAARDQWTRVGAGIPKYDAWAFYCNMEYDPGKDLVVLNVGGKGSEELTSVMRPLDSGTPVLTEPAAREVVDDTPFPPPADAAVLERLKSLPANTWVLAKPNFEPTHRSWSRMAWDPTLRAVVYQGGGHAGTTENTISAYFPEANRWVNAFKSQFPPSLFGNWADCPGLAFERGMGQHVHAREYRSLDGRMVSGSSAGFEWSTREIPAMPGPTGGPVVDVVRQRLIGFVKGDYYDRGTGNLAITDLTTGKVSGHKLTGENPAGGWMCVVPERHLLLSHCFNAKSKAMETWTLDLDKLDAWQKIALTASTPAFATEGAAQLLDIPGSDNVIAAPKDGGDLWVYSFERKAWKVLPTSQGDKGADAFGIYPQIVWDQHHGVLVHVGGVRGNMWTSRTLLLKPDFGAIRWE